MSFAIVLFGPITVVPHRNKANPFRRSSILFRPRSPSNEREFGGAAGYRPRVRSAYYERVYVHSPEGQSLYRQDGGDCKGGKRGEPRFGVVRHRLAVPVLVGDGQVVNACVFPGVGGNAGYPSCPQGMVTASAPDGHCRSKGQRRIPRRWTWSRCRPVSPAAPEPAATGYPRRSAMWRRSGRRWG